MNALSPHEIEFHPTSFCDGHGRLFVSGGKLYRGIAGDRAQFTRDLFARGVVEELEAKRFIPRTELTDASLPEYPVVLHHERIPFVSYAFEWSPSMLRDAALFDLHYLRALARHGLTLGEVAAWNILFAGSEPRAVDFCEIIEAPEDQEALWDVLESQFQSYYLRPLELIARGQSNLARLLQTDYEHGPIQREFEAATASAIRKARRRGSDAIRRRTRALDSSRSRQIGEPGSYFMKKLDAFEHRFSQFHFPAQRATGAIPSETRDLLVHECWPRSALVIGGTDEAATLLAKTGAAVVAIDRAEQRVDALYERARRERANILPLVVDLRYPAPGYGVQNAVLAPALRRLRCELVVALGLIESLVFEQRLRFEQIAGTFAELTLQRLIVDFPEGTGPSSDPYFAWYGRDQFIEELERHFHSVRPVTPNLLICEKVAR
jgi:hypothetical protein